MTTPVAGGDPVPAADRTEGAVDAGSRVVLRPVSLVEEAEEVPVGDPRAGVSGTVPAVGAVVIPRC